ncbi:MAG: hypothetical protein LBU85_01370 [Treponema sp.]|jgi:hypothetical protein|nr:hypothetical protein [Treponema sp.]
MTMKTLNNGCGQKPRPRFNGPRFLGTVLAAALIMAACKGAGGGGELKLTGMPKDSEGKFVIVYAVKLDASLILVGVQGVNKKDKTVTLARVSNGSVTVPMWQVNRLTGNMTRYSGNDTAGVVLVGIHDSEKIDSPKPLDILSGMSGATMFSSTKFSKGSASQDWKEGVGGGMFGGLNLGDMLKGLMGGE